ncbi:MAG: valine--tRNA ligase [Bacteroidetes bacterium 43-16]|nr:MAG: valine--tRNA ligase [Bacteroidetes bacterium 43-16]
MELSKNYQPSGNEEKWYKHWNEKGYFNSTPDERPAYTIVMPPPNVTGVLHMGHALNNTVQDILIRRAKAKGFNTCWVPGTDHASIATEAKVVNMLKERGINKNDLSREAFLEYAWEWKEQYGGIILQQLKKLGCSLDWNRVHFTMDKPYYDTVLKVFTDLYQKGKIYRGVKMINWDPQALTALSDEEVIFKESNSKLVYINYKIAGTDEHITIATVRPETIMGDTAICVHPEDPRYAHLRDAKAIVPLINREIPIIFDDYIDMEFGTGALKVTPAHDINDYNLGQKHRLEVIDTINDNGTLNEHAQIHIGLDRFAARKAIIADLEAAGNLVKIEDYKNQVGVSERTGAVIEPKLSMQWWCNMEEMADPALRAVMGEEIKFFPPKFKNLYRHWMSNIKDWCISRQLWWGQQIPAWYDKSGNIFVAESEEKAVAQYLAANPQGTAADLSRDEDVLDTWFSSWIWPMQVFGWNKEGANKELAYYYPTNTLVTAPDIIFFWVARMIMSGYEYMEQKPFDQVYFTGLIRDKQGRKMSKQLGNSPDLLQLIEDHGADAVRFSVMISSPAGNDILYDDAFLEQARNFNNKMWNALKLIKMWEDNQAAADQGAPHFATLWIRERIKSVSQEIEGLFKEFRLSEALKTIYSLIWDDYCSWYLEWIKPVYGSPIASRDLSDAKDIFEQLLQQLHPFMPFITEEIYHLLNEQNGDLMPGQIPDAGNADATLLAQGNLLKQLITGVRDGRNKNQLKPKDTVALYIETADAPLYEKIADILKRQVNATELVLSNNAEAKGFALVIQKEKVFVACDIDVDADAQKAKMTEELTYLKGFLQSVDKKLSNEKFVQNAKPEILANEQKKKADAEDKIKVLEESLATLS